MKVWRQVSCAAQLPRSAVLLQESVSGQGPSLTNPAAAGETVPVGAAALQPSQYTDNAQVCQQLVGFDFAVYLLHFAALMHAVWS